MKHFAILFLALVLVTSMAVGQPAGDKMSHPPSSPPDYTHPIEDRGAYSYGWDNDAENETHTLRVNDKWGNFWYWPTYCVTVYQMDLTTGEVWEWKGISYTTDTTSHSTPYSHDAEIVLDIPEFLSVLIADYEWKVWFEITWYHDIFNSYTVISPTYDTQASFCDKLMTDDDDL